MLCPVSAQAQTVDPTSVDLEVNESSPIVLVEVTLSPGCGGLDDVGLDWYSSVDLSGPPPNWLKVSPKRGDREVDDVPITLRVDAGNLEPGAYQAIVTFYITTDCDGDPLEPAMEQAVEVAGQVRPGVPSVEPTELTFSLLPDDAPASALVV